MFSATYSRPSNSLSSGYTSGYRYGYGGHEKDDEVKGSGNHLSFGNYGYDSRIGKRWNVDPLAKQIPFISPYSYCLNNPIFMIDQDGRIPYPITIRSFAPFTKFGFGFHGDGRSYSNKPSYAAGAGPTARAHQRIMFDTDKTDMTAYAWSSKTYMSDPNDSKTAKPEISFSGLRITKSGDNKTFEFGTHSAAANPKTPPGTPDIDVFSDFSITENKKAGTLTISGKLTGDNFPSTEAFITDPSGQNLFIGVGQIGPDVGKNMGPFTELPGQNKDRPITDFNFTISTDKDGNFTGVKSGDKTYTIPEWNKQFEEKKPQAEEKKEEE